MSQVKGRRRRNVFKQEELDNQQSNAKIKNTEQQIDGELQNRYNYFIQTTNSQKFEDYYDHKFESKKLEENRMYYGQNKQDVQNQIKNVFAQQNTKHEEQQTEKKRSELRKEKKRGRRKQRQFFDIQGDEEENVKKEEMLEQEKKVRGSTQNKIDEVKTEKKQQSISQVQGPCYQEDEVNKMIQKKNKQIQEKPKQSMLSFKMLLESAGTDKQQKKKIYYDPLDPGEKACCYFKRYQSGLSESYQLIGDDHRPLLFCQNQRGSIGANMYISMNKEMDKNSSSYLGKLRGNASGSEYILYDDGQTPNSKLDRSKWRISMASIQYQSNFMGWKGPRKLKVVTPRVKSGEQWDCYKLAQDQGLATLPQSLTTKYRNKQPKWNQKLKSYALNFGGRVKMASIKNFILVDTKYQVEEQLTSPSALVFGKVDQNTFSLQFCHPLSLFQAFGICMSAFDFKINCQ